MKLGDEWWKFGNRIVFLKHFFTTIVALAIVAIPVGILYFAPQILDFLVYAKPSRGPGGSIDVTKALENAPTTREFYVVILMLIGLWMSWRWYHFVRLQSAFSAIRPSRDANSVSEEKIPFSHRAWAVSYDLRKRAFALRARADLILGIVCALLLGGIYIVLFVLPHILEGDRILAEQAEQRGSFRERHGETMTTIVEGLHWLETDTRRLDSERKESGNSLRFTPDGKYAVFVGADGKVIASEDGGRSWRIQEVRFRNDEEVLYAGFDNRGFIGLLISNRGTVYRWSTQGRIWTRDSLPLENDEAIVHVAANSDGKDVLLLGTSGTILLYTNGTQKWTALSTPESDGPSFSAGVFDSIGERVLLFADDGSTYEGTTGATELSRLDFAFDENVDVSRADFANTRSFGLLTTKERALRKDFRISGRSYEYTTRDVYTTKNQGQTWELPESPLAESTRISRVVFSKNGTSMLLVGSGRKVFVRNGSAGSWRQIDLKVGDVDHALKLDGDFIPSGIATQNRLQFAAVSDDGASGLILFDGGVFYTKDSTGPEWQRRTSETLADDTSEPVDPVLFSKDGSSMVLMRDRGTPLKWNHEKKSWDSWNLPLKPGEQVNRVLFSKNKQHGILGGTKGTILVTSDPAEADNHNEPWKRVTSLLEAGSLFPVWISEDGNSGLLVDRVGLIVEVKDRESIATKTIALEDHENVRYVEVSRDGTYGIYLGNKGSVYTREGKDRAWKKSNWKRNPRTQIHEIRLSEDGAFGFLLDSNGDLYEKRGKGKEWTQVELVSGMARFRSSLELSLDGRYGLLSTTGGTLFERKGTEGSWAPLVLPLDDGDRVRSVMLHPMGTYGFMLSGDRNLFVFDGRQMEWKLNELKLRVGEAVDEIHMSENWNEGVIAGDMGSVFLVNGNTRTLRKLVLPTRKREPVTTAGFTPDGTYVVLAGRKGLVFASENGSEWTNLDLTLKAGELVDIVLFSENGTLGLLIGDEGSVFVSTDAKRKWRPAELSLRTRERISLAALNRDGSYGVLVGDEGSVFLSVDGGENWRETTLFGGSRRLFEPAVIPNEAGGYDVIALDGNENPHLLTEHSGLTEWESWSLAKVREEMEKNDVLVRTGVFRHIAKDLSDTEHTNRVPVGDGGGGGIKGLFERWFGELTVMRVLSLTVVFFLVQIFVRLYQYTLRLSAFWESRSDAILLSQHFAREKSKTFDKLVGSLGSDSFEFRPGPRAIFGWRQKLPKT